MSNRFKCNLPDRFGNFLCAHGNQGQEEKSRCKQNYYNLLPGSHEYL